MAKQKIEMKMDKNLETLLDEYCQDKGMNRKDAIKIIIKSYLDDWKDDKEFMKLIEDYDEPNPKHSEKM